MTVQDPERISGRHTAYERRGHEARYHLAAGFLRPGDRVIDAACGTGFGSAILERRGGVRYLGVDRDLSALEVEPADRRRFMQADLETWGGPSTPFDVAACFETIEHLGDPTALRDWLYRARRWVLVSVPIVPTLGRNPHHKRDYTKDDIDALFGNLYPFTYFDQPAEGSGVWVFRQW